MKKSIVFFCLISLIITMVLPVEAAVPEQINPNYVNIQTVAASLSIDEDTGLATACGHVVGYGVIPMEVNVKLQQYINGQWKTLRSWTDTGTSGASVDGTYTVDPGYQYRAFVTGYVNNDLGLPIESATVDKVVYYPEN